MYGRLHRRGHHGEGCSGNWHCLGNCLALRGQQQHEADPGRCGSHHDSREPGHHSGPHVSESRPCQLHAEDPSHGWVISSLARRPPGHPGTRRSSCPARAPPARQLGASRRCHRAASRLAAAALYSSEIQQPMRTTATLGRRPHTHQAAPFDRDQGRAGSLHPRVRAERPAGCGPAVVICDPRSPPGARPGGDGSQCGASRAWRTEGSARVRSVPHTGQLPCRQRCWESLRSHRPGGRGSCQCS